MGRIIGVDWIETKTGTVTPLVQEAGAVAPWCKIRGIYPMVQLCGECNKASAVNLCKYLYMAVRSDE